MDIYKFAAQRKLRFPSVRGDLCVEQLFDLPLKSAGGFDLDSVARGINTKLKVAGEESFVEDVTVDPQKQALSVALEVVKDAIKTRQEENAAKMNRLKKVEERKKILDAISAKKDQQLTAASLEELEKKLAELD